MRILLINSNQYKSPYPVIPFGLSYVAAVLEEAGHNVRVIDLCFVEDCATAIEQAIGTTNPELIGISVRNIDTVSGSNPHFLLEDVKEKVIDPCKSAFSGPIIIGGPSVGVNGAEMLTYFDLEFAIRGDGEAAILEFVRRLENDLPFNGLLGLVWRQDNRIIEDNPSMDVPDLNALPFVNPGRYIDLEPYRLYGSPLQVQTKRGCALKCAYCTYNAIEGHFYRYRDPHKIAEEIEWLINETGINTVEITDSSFNVPLKHTKAVLHALAEKNLDVSLSTLGVNPRAVDEELADLMQRVKFHGVSMGIEAGNDEMLESLGKNFKKEHIFRAEKLLHKRGITLDWFLLLGAPGETEQTLQETFETVDQVALPWEAVIICVGMRVFRGAPIEAVIRQENPDCTDDNFLHPVFYSPQTLSLQEIITIARRTALHRPNYAIVGEEGGTPALLDAGYKVMDWAGLKPDYRAVHGVYRALKVVSGLSRIEQMQFDAKHKGNINTNILDATLSSETKQKNGSPSTDKAVDKALVKMRTKGDNPPFFCVAGRHQDVPMFDDLAKHLGPDRPFYALQPPKSASGSPQLADIESLAAYFVTEIIRIQNTGPYHIGGFNIGGLVALEIAQQLQAGGQQVAFLALIDTPYLANNPLLQLSFRTARGFDKASKKLFRPLQEGFPSANPIQKSAQILRYAFHNKAPAISWMADRLEEDYQTFQQTVDDQGYEALLNAAHVYQPKPYTGKTALFLATESLTRLSGALNHWSKVIPQGLKVEQVPGSYIGILKEPHVKTLAQQIRTCMVA